MNRVNERQHYVSRVLLERFRLPGQPLQCYDLGTRTWKARSVHNLCSAKGYNQLVLPDGVDSIIESSFSAVESKVPETFAALERAAHQDSIVLPEPIYANLCSYCTFLKQTSPFAKAAAPVNVAAQINMELERGNYYFLRKLKVTDDVISMFQEGYLRGGRIIVQSENVVQLMYRLWFEWALQFNHAELYNSEWTISRSPIDLPMSDIGLIEMRLDDLKAKHYILPISPRLILDAVFYFDPQLNSRRPIAGHLLTPEEAEHRFDVICLSASKEIIFSQRQTGVEQAMARAHSTGIRFHKIIGHDLARSSGLQPATIKYGLQMVTADEYRRFVHSFIQPSGHNPPRSNLAAA